MLLLSLRSEGTKVKIREDIRFVNQHSRIIKLTKFIMFTTLTIFSSAETHWRSLPKKLRKNFGEVARFGWRIPYYLKFYSLFVASGLEWVSTCETSRFDWRCWRVESIISGRRVVSKLAGSICIAEVFYLREPF